MNNLIFFLVAALAVRVFGNVLAQLGSDNDNLNKWFVKAGLFFIVIAAMIVISFFTKPADFDAIKGLTIGSASKEQIAEVRGSYNRWDIINSMIIIAIIIAFYVYFW